MILTALTPRAALNKAFRKQRPSRSEIDHFRENLRAMLEKSNDVETEEFHKNLISTFLLNTFYSPNHYINTKADTDLVVHNGVGPNTPVGVLIEAKKPTNRSQMPQLHAPNTKALQELLLYYLRERFSKDGHNLDVRHLIITNAYEWFIFDANVFETEFAQNKALVQRFIDFEQGRLSGTTTDFFYREIAAPAIQAVSCEVRVTYFDLREFQAALNRVDPSDDGKLVPLFKVLSPQHLLKLPFLNDSNTLHRGFYSELLHIIGLTESKKGTRRLIGRKDVHERNAGSLLENAITQLETLDKLNRVTDLTRFGSTRDERLFGVALELVLTWINRIIFLKLIEAQLSSYARKVPYPSFLQIKTVPSFDALNGIFFQVLARRPEERGDDMRARFSHIPYLNSSLFEPTELEHETVFISSLQDEKRLAIYPSSVIKNSLGKKRSGEMPTLEYLYEFLEAYDFASDVGSTEVQEDHKSLINASVLGLIFEKINGYKDGSFFTPGFVTMHICREAVRKAVVQRFNSEKGWSCADVSDLYHRIENTEEANQIIGSVRICDPAVGSGHFLVSALNELIALKAELRLLQDRNGQRLKEYSVSVVNDELTVTDEDGDFLHYNPAHKESQRVQEALFHEKQALIESCLFGVDINPNSVHICRLRLWIELLKHAYYKDDGALETLPNIDINIKSGDSLISRFTTDVDVGRFLRRKKLRVTDYRAAIRTYQNASSKDEKRDIQTFIDRLKGDLRTEIFDNDPKVRRLYAAEAELVASENQQVLFEESEAKKKARRLREEQLRSELRDLTANIEAIRSNRIFQGAFEWCFEFPEVLADDGKFIGFDLVLGNPPYGVSIKGLEREYLVKTLGKVPDFEIYYWFMSRARQILRPQGVLGYIIPNTFLFNVNAASFRLALFDNWNLDEVLDCTKVSVFEDAVVRNAIVTFTKMPSNGALGYKRTNDVVSFSELAKRPTLMLDKSSVEASNQNWGLLFSLDETVQRLVRKLRTMPTLDMHFSASQGYIPYRQSDLAKLHGEDEAKKITEQRLWHANERVGPDYIEEIFGRSISRYAYSRSGTFVRYGKHVASFVDPKFFTQRRLLVREITNPTVIACIVDETFVNDPQIISVISKTETFSIDFLWAILNSKLARFFHFNASPKATKGLFPKILVLDVNKFPLPVAVTDETMRTVGELVREAHASGELDRSSIEEALDKVVFEMYGLDSAEISTITMSSSSYGPTVSHSHSGESHF